MSSKTSLAIALLAAAILSGCGATDVRETHVLQAQSGNGETSYFRVRIRATSSSAKTDYRSGLYDAYALDSLFGNAEEDSAGLDATLARKRAAAVAKAFEDYYDAIGKQLTETQLADFERRIARVMESPFAIADRGSGGRQHRKFAIIYSSNASAVEEAIAGLVEDQDTAKGVMALFAQAERSKYIDASTRAAELSKVQALVDQYAEEADAILAAPNFDATNNLTSDAEKKLESLFVKISALRTLLKD